MARKVLAVVWQLCAVWLVAEGHWWAEHLRRKHGADYWPLLAYRFPWEVAA